MISCAPIRIKGLALLCHIRAWHGMKPSSARVCVRVLARVRV